MRSAHCGSEHGLELHRQAGEPPCYWCARLDPGFLQAQEATRERIGQLTAALAEHKAETAQQAAKLHRAHAQHLAEALAEQRAALTAEHDAHTARLEAAHKQQLAAARASRLEATRPAPARPPQGHRHYLIDGAVIGTDQRSEALLAMLASGQARELDDAEFAQITKRGG